MVSPVDPAGRDPRDARFAADGELFRLLEKENFEGRAWTTLAERLCRHGLAVLTAWAATGMIFLKLAEKGRSLNPTEAERAAVMQLAPDLTDISVAIALRNFQDRALDGRGWQPDGGASLETYFISGCLDVFANEFRRLRRSGQLVSNDIPAPGEDLAFLLDRMLGDDEPREADFAATVANHDVIRRWILGFNDYERIIIWGKAHGWTNIEIAHLSGDRSAKAIERRWSRMMAREPQLRAIRGEEVS